MPKSPQFSILLKALLIAGILFLGVRAVIERLDEADTQGTFSFLSENNRGFAGLLIEASQRQLKTSPKDALLILQKAIQKDPVDSRSYLMMGLAYEALGDVARAKILMKEAHQLGPRKPLNQIEIGQFWFRQNDIDEALWHWTVALEMKPELREKGFKDLMLFMDKPLYLDALKRLVTRHDPLWWEAFFYEATLHIKSLDHLKLLYAARLSSGFTISPLEEHALFERLFRERQWSDAYFTWMNQLTQPSMKRLGNIFDGGFSLPPSNEGFAWRTNPDPAYQIYVRDTPQRKPPHTLDVAFNGSKPRQVTPIHQFLLLEPGNFTLKGEVSTEQLKAGEGLVWSLKCLNGLMITTTSLFQGNTPWRSFSQDFTVPQNPDCRVQDLSLTISADINQPFTYEGTARFSDLSIVPIK